MKSGPERKLNVLYRRTGKYPEEQEGNFGHNGEQG